MTDIEGKRKWKQQIQRNEDRNLWMKVLYCQAKEIKNSSGLKHSVKCNE